MRFFLGDEVVVVVPVPVELLVVEEVVVDVVVEVTGVALAVLLGVEVDELDAGLTKEYFIVTSTYELPLLHPLRNAVSPGKSNKESEAPKEYVIPCKIIKSFSFESTKLAVTFKLADPEPLLELVILWEQQ